MKPLLRLGRRRSSWELQDASVIADVEFRSGEGHDLTPSAYEVEARDEHELRARTLQVCTEHAASFLGSPPTGIPPLDLSRLDRPRATEGTTLFRYANSCHRELLFATDAELLRLVERIKFLLYTCPDGAVRAQVLFRNETAWLTRKALGPGKGEDSDA